MTVFSSHDGLALGATHGYEFHGPDVRLNAFIRWVDDARAHTHVWTLQLWAHSPEHAQCPAPLASSAILIASFPITLPIQDEFGPTSDGFFVEYQGPAHPPAGTAPWQMSLVLADENGPVDLASYPQWAVFTEPRIVGEMDLVCSAQCRLRVEAVSNPRAPDNLSGTLVLEVWMLDAPYTGGAFSGWCAGRRMLGSLAGQATFSEAIIEDLTPALFCRKSALGFPVLMLREWHIDDYLTRDFRALENLCCALPEMPDSMPALTPPPSVPQTPAVPLEVPSAPALSLETPEAPPAPALSAADEAPPPSKPSPLDTLNRLSETALFTLPGLPKTVLHAVAKGRPWASMEALKAVKGLGEQRFKKLIAFLSTR